MPPYTPHPSQIFAMQDAQRRRERVSDAIATGMILFVDFSAGFLLGVLVRHFVA